jgi:hypothetical protein
MVGRGRSRFRLVSNRLSELNDRQRRRPQLGLTKRFGPKGLFALWPSAELDSELRDARVMHATTRRPVPKNGKTLQIAGFSFSRPLSRILSRVTIPLGRRLHGGSSSVPGSSAGHLDGACFALHRTGFGEPPCHHGRWWALTPPFHPYRQRLRRDRPLPAVCFLCHFPSAFAAWGFPSVLPCGVRTFLEPRKARGHPACRRKCSS